SAVILGGKKIEVILNEEDSKLPLNLTELSKKVSIRTKTELELTLSKERIHVIGGVMLRTHDGRIAMDNTFDDLFKQKEKIIKNKISEILFK
ncbi:hypothetical protein KAI11_01705, partial [Candidatus Bathyarchaeota archaeon]|nr:hypothetical protein [Candidatus Bathyarchaeota archaeon]